MNKNLLFSLWLMITCLLTTSVFGQVTVRYEFRNTSGNIDENVSFETIKNSASAPAIIGGNQLRLYSHRSSGDGNELVIKVEPGYKLTNITIVRASNDENPNSVKYYLSDNTSYELSNNTISNINEPRKVRIKNEHFGGNSNLQLRLTSISVTYEAVASLPVASKPTFSITGNNVGENTYLNSATVALATSTEGATIRYALGGTIPDSNSPVYSAPILIDETTTIKAIAIKDGMTTSAVAEQVVTIVEPTYTQVTSLSPFTHVFGQGPSSVQTFTLRGQNMDLEDNTLLLFSELGFEISTDGINFSDELELPIENLTLNLPLYVRFNGGENVGIVNAYISVIGGGTDMEIPVQGNVTLPRPTAIAATAVTPFSFQANWESIGNGVEYEVNVYKTESYASPELVVNGDFNDELSNWTGSGIEDFSVVNEGEEIYIRKTTTRTSRIEQILDVVSGQNYVMEFWYKDYDATNSNGLKNYTIQGTTGSVYIDSGTPKLVESINEWKRNSITFTATSDKVKISIRAYQKASIDKISIKKVGTSESLVPIQGSPFSSTTNSLDIVDLEELTTYTYNVVAKQNDIASEVSNSIEVTTLEHATTWNGTVWSNDAPNGSIRAILAANPTASFTAKQVAVRGNDEVVIPSGITVTVVDHITVDETASLTFQPGAYLLQTNPEAINTGDVTYQVQSQPMMRNDMSHWSSPVKGQNIRAFSPGTLYNRFWRYEEENSYYRNIFSSDNDPKMETEEFREGEGIAIRVKYDILPEYNAPTIGEFKGELNNGTITVPVTKSAGENAFGFNLVGNPYPSPISVTAFLEANPSVNQLFIWTPYHKLGTTLYGNNYITITRSEVIGPNANVNYTKDFVAAGQGFFVEMANDTIPYVQFTNDMRIGTSTIFQRTEEEDAFKLELQDHGEVTNQLAINYLDGSTNAHDHQYDARSVETGNTRLYTLIGHEQYSIQARPSYTDTEEFIPLGYITDKNGELTIALSQLKGVFATDQIIYIKDKALNIIHNLTAAPYTFSTERGEFNSRFEVVYSSRTLGLGEVNKANGVKVYRDGDKTVVYSEVYKLASIKLYDTSGRFIQEVKNINSTQTQLKLSSGIYFLTILLENNSTISEKVFIK